LKYDLQLEPVVLTGEAATTIDKLFNAYFEIQAALANDTTAPPVSVNTLVDSLVDALANHAVPDQAQRELSVARQAAERLVGQIEDSRVAFRTVSHALIKTLQYVRGTTTENGIHHFFCPMVPGGGGDWLQANTDLKNPYWGSQMLTCGELARDLSLSPNPMGNEPNEDPFEGLEVQSLDFED
jgi:Cu(I)/Ag(I) efflux system membrane fusion protein